jgi:hypothetical protein
MTVKGKENDINEKVDGSQFEIGIVKGVKSAEVVCGETLPLRPRSVSPLVPHHHEPTRLLVSLILRQDPLDTRDLAQVALSCGDLFVSAGSDPDVGRDARGSHLVARNGKERESDLRL